MKKVKVRFLAQGILTIPNDQIPEGWHEWDARDKWDWLMEWWGLNITDAMLREALLLDDVPGDPAPALLEVFDGEDYRTIAQSNEYYGYWNCENATAMYEGKD